MPGSHYLWMNHNIGYSLAPHLRQKPPFPSKEDILAFIGRQPGKVGTRELARAFGLKNDDRAALKRILRELADDGHVERRRKSSTMLARYQPSCWRISTDETRMAN